MIGVEVSDEDENFISMTRLGEMNYAALTIQRGWRWTRKRIGASAKKKTESLKEMKSTLKAVEKEWRMLFNEELANLELDLCVRSRRVER